jgi:hypothetical protein
MAIRDLKSVIYTDEFGRDYACRMDAALFAQVGASTNRKVGGSDYAGTPELPPMPTNMTPRHVLVSNAGNKRRVVCLDPTSELFLGTETTVTLQVVGTTPATYNRFEKVSEKYHTHLDPSG